MSTTIQDILAPLDPHWDRIVRRPLTDTEIDDLQKQVGVPIPELFRDYLAQVGLFQDLTAGGTFAIELYDTPAEFASALQFLSNILKPKSPQLFPFGGDGAGNEFCLPCDPNAPCRIHFVDHETGRISKRKEFTAWLESVVAKVLKGIRKRPLNERKAWCVQFCFQTTSFDELIELLASAGKVKQIDRGWMNRETNSAEVTSTDRRIEFNGETVQVRRLEYAGWDTPLMSFDMSEPVLAGLEGSQIRVLKALFKKNCPDYKLVDYGPLDKGAT